MTPERDAERIAKLICGHPAVDECNDAESYFAAATHHSGDCTNECHTCILCRVTMYRELAQQVIAALSQGRATTAEGDDWKRRYEDEYAIVDRCWKALGITTYEQANGRAIHEIIASLQAERDAAVAALRWAMDEIDALAGQACGFAYPQAMPMLGRAGQDMHYVAAVQARRAAALKGDAKPATEEK